MASPAPVRESERTYEPEDVLAMDDGGKAFELNADGELEERAMGALSSRVGFTLGRRLDDFGDDGRRGIVFPADVPLCCWPDAPRRLRRPDVAFVAASDLSGGEVPDGVLTVVPLLVAEVVSPRENATSLERKVDEYLAAGIPLVWVIYPRELRAFVRRPDGTVTLIPPDGVLSGEDILPGFEVALRDLLPSTIARGDP